MPGFDEGKFGIKINAGGEIDMVEGKEILERTLQEEGLEATLNQSLSYGDASFIYDVKSRGEVVGTVGIEDQGEPMGARIICETKGGIYSTKPIRNLSDIGVIVKMGVEGWNKDKVN